MRIMKDVIIPNPKKLEKSKSTISGDGADKLHILADFDRTLTPAFIEGQSTPSIIAILRDGSYLTPDYAKKAHELYNKYHPIEIDPKIPIEKKKKAMNEWWETHFNLLIKSRLNKKDLERIVESKKIKFRNKALEFIDFLKAHNIPLVIMSSSGLGNDVISMILKKEGKLYDNVHIISNSYEWDEGGNMIAVRKPFIHTMNKDETSVRGFPAFEVIKHRKNVLLLGDNLDDIGMIKGFDYDNLINIGFLNENVEENLEHYKKNYDVVILNDSSMDYVNKILKEMLK